MTKKPSSESRSSQAIIRTYATEKAARVALLRTKWPPFIFSVDKMDRDLIFWFFDDDEEKARKWLAYQIMRAKTVAKYARKMRE